jgi:hypothetical protein
VVPDLYYPFPDVLFRSTPFENQLCTGLNLIKKLYQYDMVILRAKLHEVECIKFSTILHPMHV